MTLENITLEDRSAGTSAEILAGLGFNCHRFTARPAGQMVEALWAAEDFASGQQRPSGSGVPILFPFPGRIRGTEFRWAGRTYSLPAGDKLGNAIHGFVHTRPWRVVERGERRVVGEFQAARDDASLLERWPADFRLTATYELAGNTLRLTCRAENTGEAPLPCGLGLHPYFRVPLGGTQANACLVRAPVTAEWELADMLPTGRRAPLVPADAWTAGRRFGEIQVDGVFAGLVSDGDGHSASVADPESGRQLRLDFDRAFRECVLFTPPHREAVCIEPYTCVPNAAELAERGIDAGLRVLAPGDAFTAALAICVE